MEIRALIEKRGKYSQAEIDYIIAEGAKVGVMPPKRRGCSNCWRDMAIEIAYAQRQAKPKGTRLRGNAARDGVVFMGRVIVNPIDPETLAWMRANGFPEHLLTDKEDED